MDSIPALCLKREMAPANQKCARTNPWKESTPLDRAQPKVRSDKFTIGFKCLSRKLGFMDPTSPLAILFYQRIEDKKRCKDDLHLLCKLQFALLKNPT
eukprot:UN27896